MDTTGWILGFDDMGYGYNVRDGEYARSVSIDKSEILFDLNMEEDGDDPDADTGLYKTVDDTSYWIPNPLAGTLISDSTIIGAEVYESSEVWTQNSDEISLSGGYGTFSASVSVSYSEEYSSSSAYWQTDYKANYPKYKLELPDDIKSYLTDAASTDINGDMSATDVIEKYGTHYLAKGIFGGIWTYSQSISKYTESDETTIAVDVTASVLGYQESGVSTSDSSNTNSTDSSQFQIATVGGGSYDSLSAAGFGDWVDSIPGAYVLIDFPDSDSLLPISTLADESDRQDALEAAIEAYFSDVDQTVITDLEVNADQIIGVYDNDAGESAQQGYISKSSDEVMIGFGARVDDNGGTTRMLLRYLNVKTGDTPYYAFGADTSLEPTHYELYYEAPTGCALVGLGAAVDGNNMTGITGYYMSIDAESPTDNSNHLDGVVESDYVGADKQELSYTPASASSAIPLVGIRFATDSNSVIKMKLYGAALEIA